MIHLLHQCEQPADFALGKTGARKPMEIVGRKVGNQRALVLAKGHFTGNQQFKVFGMDIQ